MRITHLVPGLGLALALAVAPAASAQNPKPNKPPGGNAPNASALTLEAKPSTIVFSGLTTLSGRLTADKADGVTVRFEQDNTRPYGDGYKPVAGVTATTANNGRYSLSIKPLLNTSFRAVAQSSPPTTSPARVVLVRTLVGIRVSDSTPRRGSLVRFSGTVFPAHDGGTVLIQKRSSTGSFNTVARKRLTDAGAARSTYSRRLRIFRDGVYRVKLPGDGDHINGFSRLKTINVGG